MSRREAAVYSTAILCVACVLLYCMRYMRSELAVTVMFLLAALLLFVAATSIYSLLSKDFFYGKHHFELAIDENNITMLEKISGKKEIIPWGQIAVIATWTRLENMDGKGSDQAYDYHWCIKTGNGSEYSFPFYSIGNDALIKRIKLLPGLDPKRLAAATSGTKDGHAIVWERKGR